MFSTGSSWTKTQSSAASCASLPVGAEDEEEEARRVDWLEPSELSMISLMSFLNKKAGYTSGNILVL